jgi:hypothetical protein
MGTTAQKLANYLRAMVDDGYLAKLGMSAGKFTYVYMKTGKKME